MEMHAQATGCSIMTHRSLICGTIEIAYDNHDEIVAHGRHKPAKRQIVTSCFMQHMH